MPLRPANSHNATVRPLLLPMVNSLYIDSYYYYHDCDNYHFLKQDDASSRGGYAPLHGSMTQVRDLDDLSSKTIYYLTRSSNDKKQKTTEYRNTDHYSAGEYRVEVFERR